MKIQERFSGVTAIQLEDGWHAVEVLNVVLVENEKWFACQENLSTVDSKPMLFELSGPLSSIFALRKKM